MKRCPECEFLYEDEQERCDMDGTVLRFTSFLPPLAPPKPPIVKTDVKSIWGGITIPLLALVILSTIVVLLYRATPATFSSSSGLKKHAEKQELKPPASDSPQMVTAPDVPREADESASAAATRNQINAARSNRPAPSVNEKPITVAPPIHAQVEPVSPVISAPKPATSQTSPPPANQKPAANSYKIAVHPEPPPASPTPQPKTQKPEKDSGLKSLFKKAGRMLKKPF